MVGHADIQARMQEEIDDLRHSYKQTAKALLALLSEERDHPARARNTAEQAQLEIAIAHCVTAMLTL